MKLLFIFFFLLSDYQAVLTRFALLDSIWMGGVFVLLYAMLTLGLIAAAYIRRWPLRLSFAIVFSAAAFVQISYEWTTGAALDYDQALALSASAQHFEGAMEQFAPILMRSAAATLLLFLGVALPPERTRFSSRWLWTGPVGALLLTTAMLYVRDGSGARGLPASYPMLSYASFMGLHALTQSKSARIIPVAPPKAPRTQGDIVLIVDESISANYLDLANPSGMRSGLQQTRPNLRVTNFGYAAAISTCSASSNAILRFGGSQATHLTAYQSWKPIWAYAHQAGMQTVYIEGQLGNGALQNMMTAREARQIDDYISIGSAPAYGRDQKIADILARLLNNGRRDFIYINKLGAHFPVTDKYPPTRARYQPLPPRALEAAIATASRAGLLDTSDQWARYRNAYRNAVGWAVGGFFDQLLAKATLSNATIIYTSDHGQDLHERSNPGYVTHCNPQTGSMEQYLVPLAILENTATPSLNWSAALGPNYNRASAFRIFPTLLLLMGYDRAEVTKTHGHPLDDLPQDRFAGLTSFRGDAGLRPRFIDLDLAQMVLPPASDGKPAGPSN